MQGLHGLLQIKMVGMIIECKSLIKKYKIMKTCYLVFLLSLFMLVGCTDNASLEAVVQIAKKELPERIDEGLVVTNIFKENKNIIYVCSVDENIYDLDAIKELSSEIKDEMIDELNSDSDTRELLKQVKNIDGRIIYRYKGKSTGRKVDVVINNYDF